MGFAIEGRKWTPPKKPRNLRLKDGAGNVYLSTAIGIVGTRRLCSIKSSYVGSLINSKNAYKLGKWLIRFSSWADKKYKF